MVSLLSFPVEIINHILESVDTNDKQTYFQLSLVCNTLKELTTPIMYQTVVLWELNDKGYQCAPTPSFLYSILSSPTRASMVKTFAITSPACKATPEMADFNAFRARLRGIAPTNTILDLWEKYLLSDGESWTDHGLSGCTALLTALSLPNLNTLFLGGPFTYRHWNVLNSVLRDSKGNGDTGCGIWPVLDAVTIHNMWDRTPDNTAPLTLFASLPRIRHLHGVLLVDPEVPNRKTFSLSPRPHTTELEELVIQPSCYLHHKFVETLFQAPKNLRVFRYQAGRALADIPFKTRWLENLLRHQSHALEEISLTHGFYEADEDSQATRFDEAAEIDRMSFSSFSALETLEISPAFVFGHEALQLAKDKFYRAVHAPDPSEAGLESTKQYLVQMLPKSIITLRFTQCSEFWEAKRLNRALIELICQRDYLFPNLNTIEVHILHYRKGDWIFQLHRSVLEARHKGVNMKIFRGGALGIEGVGGEDVRNVYSLHYQDNDTQLQELDILGYKEA